MGDLIDNAIVDTFAESLIRIDRVGPCRRLVFVVMDPTYKSDPCPVVVSKMILPADALLELARAILSEQRENDGGLSAKPSTAVAH